MKRFLSFIFIALITIVNTHASEQKEFKILYLVDNNNNFTAEKYFKDVNADIINLNNNFKDIINKSISNPNYSFNDIDELGFDVTSGVIHVNFEDMMIGNYENLNPNSNFNPFTTDVNGLRINGINENVDFFGRLLYKLESNENNFIEDEKSNNKKYNHFINRFYNEIMKNDPDLIVTLISNNYSSLTGRSYGMLGFNSNYEDSVNNSSSLSEISSFRKLKPSTKLITLNKDFLNNNLSIYLAHEMGHTFLLHHDPMTSYKQEIDENPNKVLKDFDFTNNLFYFPDGKGLFKMINNIEYGSVMTYPQNGETSNAVRLPYFSNPEMDINGQYKNSVITNEVLGDNTNSTITIPYQRLNIGQKYTSIKEYKSSNESKHVKYFLDKLTDGTSFDDLEYYLLDYTKDIRNNKFYKKMTSFKYLGLYENTIFYTSLLEDNYNLETNNNIFYLSTDIDIYKINETEGNTFVLDELRIKELFEVSEEGSKSNTLLKHFNENSKMFLPIDGDFDFCLNLPNYYNYEKYTDESKESQLSIDDYEEYLCDDVGNSTKEFSLIISYENKSIEINLLPINKQNKLLFDVYNENIYKDNSPFGYKASIKRELDAGNPYNIDFPDFQEKETYSNTYLEFSIRNIVSQEDDNDNNIIPTIPSTSGSDDLVGTDGNDIMGNPDFESIEWKYHNQNEGDTYRPGKGDDLIYGSPYSDVYIFEGDFGKDIIFDKAKVQLNYYNQNTYEDFDVIEFKDLNINDVEMERHQYDLIINVKGTENVVIVEDFFNVIDLSNNKQYEINQIEFIQFKDATITAQEITDTLNAVYELEKENTAWGELDVSNTFEFIEGKNIYVGGIKKDKYIIDSRMTYSIKIKDRGGFDTLFIEKGALEPIGQTIDLNKLHAVRANDDLNLFYNYKKIALIKNQYKNTDRSIETLEYYDFNNPDLPVLKTLNIHSLRWIESFYGDLPNRDENGDKFPIEDIPVNVFTQNNYSSITYFIPRRGNHEIKILRADDAIILNSNAGLKTINTTYNSVYSYEEGKYIEGDGIHVIIENDIDPDNIRFSNDTMSLENVNDLLITNKKKPFLRIKDFFKSYFELPVKLHFERNVETLIITKNLSKDTVLSPINFTDDIYLTYYLNNQYTGNSKNENIYYHSTGFPVPNVLNIIKTKGGDDYVDIKHMIDLEIDLGTGNNTAKIVRLSNTPALKLQSRSGNDDIYVEGYNAELTLKGGDDKVNLYEKYKSSDNKKTADVNLGAGLNSLNSLNYNTVINSGSEKDEITLDSGGYDYLGVINDKGGDNKYRFNNMGVYLTSGKGDDILDMSGYNTDLKILLKGGNNIFNIKDFKYSPTLEIDEINEDFISFGNGFDSLNIDNSRIKDLKINLFDADDLLNIKNTELVDVDFTSGNGNKTVLIENSRVSGGVVNLGIGSNDINIINNRTDLDWFSFSTDRYNYSYEFISEEGDNVLEAVADIDNLQGAKLGLKTIFLNGSSDLNILNYRNADLTFNNGIQNVLYDSVEGDKYSKVNVDLGSSSSKLEIINSYTTNISSLSGDQNVKLKGSYYDSSLNANLGSGELIFDISNVKNMNITATNGNKNIKTFSEQNNSELVLDFGEGDFGIVSEGTSKFEVNAEDGNSNISSGNGLEFSSVLKDGDSIIKLSEYSDIDMTFGVGKKDINIDSSDKFISNFNNGDVNLNANNIENVDFIFGNGETEINLLNNSSQGNSIKMLLGDGDSTMNISNFKTALIEKGNLNNDFTLSYLKELILKLGNGNNNINIDNSSFNIEVGSGVTDIISKGSSGILISSGDISFTSTTSGLGSGLNFDVGGSANITVINNNVTAILKGINNTITLNNHSILDLRGNAKINIVGSSSNITGDGDMEIETDSAFRLQSGKNVNIVSSVSLGDFQNLNADNISIRYTNINSPEITMNNESIHIRYEDQSYSIEGYTLVETTSYYKIDNGSNIIKIYK